MKRFFILPYLCILFFFLIQNSSKGDENASAHFESSFVFEGRTITLKLKKTFITINGGYGEKLDFSVFRAGKFLHANTKEGGTAIGCRQPFSKPNEPNPIQKLEINGLQQGWWISTMETCGRNSLSLNVLTIPKADRYISRSFVSTFQGVLARPQANGSGIEVWFSRYVECGAMATAISVPHLEAIDGKTQLPTNLAAWPERFKPTYQQAFLAGLADKNVAVLESAKALLEEKTVRKTEACLAEGVPDSRSKLEEIIKGLQVLQATKTLQYLGI